MANEENYNIYVGSEIGVLKRIKLKNDVWENINSVSEASKEEEITCMCWDDDEETVVCFGSKNHKIVKYDTMSGESVSIPKCDTGTKSLSGIAKFEENFVTCSESGMLKVWENDVEKGYKEIGAGICRMRQNLLQPHLVATGGKENDLKLWDLNDLSKPVFQAKNVSNDWLNLRVPVWIADIGFAFDSQKIVTCTGLHQVRVYDPLSNQRRPVIEVNVDEHPLTCLSVRQKGQQVAVGSSQGRLTLVDLRGKGSTVQSYKGFSGSIRDVQCCGQTLVSCGLDRFLRVHDIDSKKLLHKVYLKARLNCLLCHTKVDFREGGTCAAKAIVKDISCNNNSDVTVQETDELWEHMETVTSAKLKKLKRSKQTEENICNKKKLKKANKIC